MKEWIEQNLLSHKGGIVATRMNRKWFVSRGFLPQYEALSQLDEDITRACKIIIGKITPCLQCGTLCERIFCCLDCVYKSDYVKSKSKQTNLDRYGTLYGFQNEEVKKKIKETNIARYGVDNPQKNSLIREKTKNTNKYPANADFFQFIQFIHMI